MWVCMVSVSDYDFPLNGGNVYMHDSVVVMNVNVDMLDRTKTYS